MRTEHFHRDTYYDARLRPSVSDPFDVRVFDYRIHKTLAFFEAEQLAQAVLAAFDSFRTGIARDGFGCTQAYYVEDRRAYCEYSELDTLRGVSATREEFRQANLRSINLYSRELVKFYYFVSRAENATVLRVVCSHFAMDQTTHGLLGRFIARYAAGERTPEKKDPGYLDWMSAYHHYATSKAGHDEASFWRNYSVGQFAEVQRSIGACAPETGVRATYTLPSVAATELADLCKTRLRCRIADALAAQVLGAIGKEYGLERVPVSWTAHGRYPIGGCNFVRTPGWLGERHPLIVSVGGGNIEALPGNFRQELSSLPVWGNAFGWVSRFADDSGLDELLKSPFIFNVQESAGAARTLFDRGGLTFEPFARLGMPPRIYTVITVGASVRLSLECAGGADPEACKRIALRLQEMHEALCV